MRGQVLSKACVQLREYCAAATLAVCWLVLGFSEPGFGVSDFVRVSWRMPTSACRPGVVVLLACSVRGIHIKELCTSCCVDECRPTF